MWNFLFRSEIGKFVEVVDRVTFKLGNITNDHFGCFQFVGFRQKDGIGWAAVHLAAIYCHDSCLKLLLEHGCDADQV